MKLGFVSAILPEYTLEQVLSFAQEPGFSSVELMCWPPGKSERRYAGVTHIDATNLSPARSTRSTTCWRPTGCRSRDWAIIPTRSRPIGPRREVAATHLRAVIDAAAALGVGVVNTFVGRDPALSVEANWPRFLEVWRPLDRPRREPRGSRSASRTARCSSPATNGPAARTWRRRRRSGGRMFDDIPSPNFGLNFDPSHLIWQQMDYLAPLAEFKDRIFHVHAKDARIDRAALDQHGVLVLSQSVAHAQDPRPGRRPLGPVLRRPERRRLHGARRDRGRGSRVRGLARIAARLADHQPPLPAPVLQRLSGRGRSLRETVHRSSVRPSPMIGHVSQTDDRRLDDRSTCRS